MELTLVLLRAPKRPELVADEVEGRHDDDRDRLRGHLVELERDEEAEDDEVGSERDERDDEEAEPLVVEMPAVAPEGPEPVPGVVVGDGDDEELDELDPVLRPAQGPPGPRAQTDRRDSAQALHRRRA